MLKPYQLTVLAITDQVEQILFQMAVGEGSIESRAAQACVAAMAAFSMVPRKHLATQVAIHVENLDKIKTCLGSRVASNNGLSEEQPEKIVREIIALYADLISHARDWNGPK